MTPTLSTRRLRLDPLDTSDAAALARALADPALYSIIGGEPPNEAGLRSDIERWNQGPRRAAEAWHNWTIRLAPEDTVIGQLQATVVDDGTRADIAWMVGTPWQGSGYASEAAIELVRWLSAAGVGVVTAHIHRDNLASGRVAARAGLAPTEIVERGEIVWRGTVGRAENGRADVDPERRPS